MDEIQTAFREGLKCPLGRTLQMLWIQKLILACSGELSAGLPVRGKGTA